jgi:prephenate dehydrogenase
MKQTIGIIGIGAFGALMVPHLTPHFDVFVHDTREDVETLAQNLGVTSVPLGSIARCDVIILATPLSYFSDILKTLAPQLRAGQLVMDVASVKVIPTHLMKDILPDYVDCMGLHPLFGPQSGKNGIAGLNIAVCPVRGARTESVDAFLRETLKLNSFITTPEHHDQQMAYVQGLTHMISKVFVAMDLPDMQLTTRTFDYLQNMVELVRYDSDELFRTIQNENPYVEETKSRFFEAVKALEARLHSKN